MEASDHGEPEGRPLLAGVVGWPVAHSLSPVIFRHWFARHGLEGDYVRLPVRPEDVCRVIPALARAGFRGVNVTIPHKETVLGAADVVGPTAKAIGAANLLVFGTDGAVRAENTDVFGFLESLRQGASGWCPESGPALVLGAGGAARAVVYGLVEAGVPEIRLTNRTLARARELARTRGDKVRTIPWEERHEALADVSLVVNATSLGMVGQPPLDLDLGHAAAGAVVADIVYRPLETPLLAAARACGLVAVDGLGMLLHQARPAFRAWFGIDPAVDEVLRQVALEALG